MEDRILRIRWERLLVDGETCPRCSETERELERAAESLRELLAPLGVEVVVEKGEIPEEVFREDPLLSNRILIDGRPLEDYLGAQVGTSPCCDVCGPADCRTLEVDGKSYEAVPAALIVRAALMALSQGQRGCCGPTPCCP